MQNLLLYSPSVSLLDFFQLSTKLLFLKKLNNDRMKTLPKVDIFSVLFIYVGVLILFYVFTNIPNYAGGISCLKRIFLY
jgi:hypothetical protein